MPSPAVRASASLAQGRLVAAYAAGRIRTLVAGTGVDRAKVAAVVGVSPARLAAVLDRPGDAVLTVAELVAFAMVLDVPVAHLLDISPPVDLVKD